MSKSVREGGREELRRAAGREAGMEERGMIVRGRGQEKGVQSRLQVCLFESRNILIILLTFKVDVVILEVGIGGAYDSTNIIRYVHFFPSLC